MEADGVYPTLTLIRFLVKNVLARTATIVPLSAPVGNNLDLPYVLHALLQNLRLQK